MKAKLSEYEAGLKLAVSLKIIEAVRYAFSRVTIIQSSHDTRREV